MVLTASFVLSPVIGLVCHRRWRIEACLHPVGPTCLRKLDAGVEASGPHDFAVRSNISRQHAIDRSQATARPAITLRAQSCRVHRIPCPTSVTIAKRPLCPESLAECANGRLPINRPLLELSPQRPKAIEPATERGTAPVSSSTRTVAGALSPHRARKGVD